MCLCMLVHAYACFSFLFACMCFVRVVRLSHLWSSCSTHSRHACKSCRNCACVGLAITVCIYMPCMAVYLVVSLPKTTVYTLYIYGPGQRSVHTPYIWSLPCQKYCTCTACTYGSGQPCACVFGPSRGRFSLLVCMFMRTHKHTQTHVSISFCLWFEFW